MEVQVVNSPIGGIDGLRFNCPFCKDAIIATADALRGHLSKEHKMFVKSAELTIEVEPLYDREGQISQQYKDAQAA
jgi:hypothetical protein